MTVLVKLYDGIKYEKDSKVYDVLKYEIKDFRVTSSYTITKVLKEFGFDTDPWNEYVILDLGKDKKITYRNSYVDIFKF